MKIKISESESYPVYCIADDPAGYHNTLADRTVEVPDDLAADWKRIEAEFARMQVEMAACWRERIHASPR